MIHTARQRERGTALVTVMIVTVGVMGMLSVLFTLGELNARSQAATAKSYDMQLLLRTGVAEAFEELRTATDHGGHECADERGHGEGTETESPTSAAAVGVTGRSRTR